MDIVAISQLQDRSFNRRLGTKSMWSLTYTPSVHVGFLHGIWFSFTSKKHAKFPLCVRVCTHPGIIFMMSAPPHVQCFRVLSSLRCIHCPHPVAVYGSDKGGKCGPLVMFNIRLG